MTLPDPYHPWDWHIYLHEWLIFMVNVGKYTSPMDAMGELTLTQTDTKKLKDVILKTDRLEDSFFSTEPPFRRYCLLVMIH